MNNLEFNLDLNAKGFMAALQNAGADIASFAMKGVNHFADTGGAAGRMGRAVAASANIIKSSLGGAVGAVGGTVQAMHHLNGAISLVSGVINKVQNLAAGAMGMAQLVGDAEDAADALAKMKGEYVEHGATFNELKDGLIKGWQEVQIEFAKPIVDALKPAMENGKLWMDGMKTDAQEVGEKIAKWAQYIVGAAKAGKGLDAVMLDLRSTVVNIADGLMSAYMKVVKWAQLKINDAGEAVMVTIAETVGDPTKGIKREYEMERQNIIKGYENLDQKGFMRETKAGINSEYDAMQATSAQGNAKMAVENTAAEGRNELQKLKDDENKKIQDENKAQADADQKQREAMMDGKWNFDTNELIDSAKEQKQAAQEQKNAAKTQREAASMAKLTATPAIGRALGTLRSFAQEMQGNGAAEGAAPQSKAIQRMSIQDRVKQGIPTTMQERIRAGLVKPNLGLSTQPAKTKAEEQQGGQNKDAALLEAVQQILQFFQKQLSPV